MTPYRFMLDTNAISQIVRYPNGPFEAQVARVGENRLCVSAIVASEARYGVRKRGSIKLGNRVEAVLSRIAIIPYDADASLSYATVRLELERLGTPISANDLLIAAHALSKNLALVTSNTKEFRRVKGLEIEDWTEQGKTR